jgi:hypothetical protein
MNRQTNKRPDETLQPDDFWNYLETRRKESGACPNEADFKAYFKGTLPEVREATIRNHIVVCHSCRNKVLSQNAKAFKLSPKFVAAISTLVFILAIGLTWFLLERPTHQANVSFVRLEPLDQIYRNDATVLSVVHDPSQRLILQFNTEDLTDYDRYSVELLDGPIGQVVWRDDGLQRQPDRSFVIDVPARYRQGSLYLRLRGEDQILAEYQLKLTEP